MSSPHSYALRRPSERDLGESDPVLASVFSRPPADPPGSEPAEEPKPEQQKPSAVSEPAEEPKPAPELFRLLQARRYKNGRGWETLDMQSEKTGEIVTQGVETVWHRIRRDEIKLKIQDAGGVSYVLATMETFKKLQDGSLEDDLKPALDLKGSADTTLETLDAFVGTPINRSDWAPKPTATESVPADGNGGATVKPGSYWLVDAGKYRAKWRMRVDGNTYKLRSRKTLKVSEITGEELWRQIDEGNIRVTIRNDIGCKRWFRTLDSYYGKFLKMCSSVSEDD